MFFTELKKIRAMINDPKQHSVKLENDKQKGVMTISFWRDESEIVLKIRAGLVRVDALLEGYNVGLEIECTVEGARMFMGSLDKDSRNACKAIVNDIENKQKQIQQETVTRLFDKFFGYEV